MNIKGIDVQERDRQVLEIIQRYGAINSKVLSRIYGKDYYVKRIRKLKKYKYISKIKNGIYVLGSEGQKYLEESGIEVIKPINMEDRFYEKYADASYIGYLLNEWQLVPSREAKARFNLNRGMKMLGILMNNKDNIFIYKIPAKIGKIGVDRIKKELNNIRAYGYDAAILLSNSNDFQKLFGIDSCLLTNLYIMPDNDGTLMIINTMATTNLSQWAVSNLYDLRALRLAKSKAFDYENESEYIVSLIDYNIAKVDYILDYIVNMNGFLSIKKAIKVICFEGQVDVIKEKFGKEIDYVTIVTIPNEKLIELVQK